MHFLLDGALFLLLVCALLIAGAGFWSPRRSASENLLLPGAAFLGFYALAMGIVGLWRLDMRFWLWAPLPIFVWILATRGVKVTSFAREIGPKLKSLSRWEKVAALYLFAVFALTFFLSLAPPNGADYDSLTYHLAVPAQYLRLGRVVELRFDHHSYFPFTLEMLYAWGLAARGEVFAKLFHWLMLPLACGALVAIGSRHFSRLGGLFAACLFASLPVVMVEASTAYIDIGFTAFALLSVLCFLNRQENKNWLIWSGIFCGFCLGSKYLGALVFGFLLFWMFGSSLKNRRFEPKPMASFALAAILVGGFWYLRNWIWVGNPVYPFAYGVFGGAGWTAQMAQAYDLDQAKFGFGKGFFDWIWLPWRLAMTPLNVGVLDQKLVGLLYWPFSDQPLANPKQSGIFDVAGQFVQSFPGPAMLAFGLPAFFSKNKPRAIVVALWFFGFLWIFWAATSQQVRYLLPAFALLALASGWNLEIAARRSPIIKIIGGAALLGWFLFVPFLVCFRASYQFPVLLGAETPENYLARTFSAYPAMVFLNQNTPLESKIAVFGESRDFYLERDYFWADDAHNNLVDYSQISDGAALAKALKALGATYLLSNTAAGTNGGGFGPPQGLIDDATKRGALDFLVDLRGYRIYRIVG